MVRFAALRFTEDENIRDRVYWYRCAFETKTGERVLAPVGSHDRLQCARVERVLFAEEGDAPYDPALLKDVAAPLGARSFLWEGRTCFELGGVRYDQKRFTRFRVFACLFGEPPAFAPAGYALVPISGGKISLNGRRRSNSSPDLQTFAKARFCAGKSGRSNCSPLRFWNLRGRRAKCAFLPSAQRGILPISAIPKRCWSG